MPSSVGELDANLRHSYIFAMQKNGQDYRGNIFNYINTNLDDKDFKRRNTNGNKGFIRVRTLTFKITFLFISTLLRRSIQRELNDFFGRIYISGYSIQHVTKSAFTQARLKLKAEAFSELSSTVVNTFYEGPPLFVMGQPQNFSL